MQKPTKNIFAGGLNTDKDKNIIESSQYIEAHNVELVSDNNFYALKNIKGTTSVQNIINVADTDVLGVFETKYKIDTTFDIQCLTIITATEGGNLKLWCYDTQNDNLYELYEESVESDYFTDDRIIDAVRHAENGIDILYFTDFYNEVRALRCEIPFPYSANFLNENDLSLQKRGASGEVTMSTIATGGSLLSGTYQFAYRMVDPAKKKFTKWSTLTRPIHVYITESFFVSYSGIGLPTDKKITLAVNATTEEIANFPNFQIAVIENIYPTATSSLTASLLPIQDVADIGSIVYRANTRIGTVPIEDIVVPLAAIQTVKTLNVKLNKLFAGNVKYRSLELDNGTPVITSGSIATVTKGTGTLYYDPTTASNSHGYFRDEVYRFGIVYYDKYGNHSAPVALDLSTVTGNIISGSLTDMRFPSRETSNSYSLLNNTDSPRGIGLQLNGIDNHPTWAVAFEIVRVKRIKRILFQTPIIPITYIEGIGAFGRYPSSAVITDDENDSKSYSDAQPMTSSKIFVPKNLFIPERREIRQRTTTVGSDANKKYKGESEYIAEGTYNYGIIFPDSTLYGGTPFTFSGNEKLETIDFCILKLDVEDFSGTEVTQHGGFVNTSISGNFHAIIDDSYYFDSAHAKTITDADNQIIDYAFIDALSSGVVLGGEKVFQYSELETKGISIGYTPSNQKMAVVKLKSNYEDENMVAKTFVGATKNTFATNGFVFGSSGVKFQPRTSPTENLDNRFVTEYSGFSENSSYVQTLRIVNVIRGEIGDDRYGDLTDQHEYISTGCRYIFDDAELVDVQAGNSLPVTPSAIWGGDCFVSHHTFKVSDSVYSISNVDKNSGSNDSTADLIDRWKIIFNLNDVSGPNSKLMMPIALEKAAQFVQLYLESEYNGEVRDYDVLERKATVGNTPRWNVNGESSIRTPLTYNYNINLSKENDQKVYISEPTTFIKQNDFEARIIISDQKIYNSDQQGFDVFRVLNFYDLEESGGHLTKLGLAGDNLYAIQERKVIYLPVGATQIEQTDGGTLSVGTGSDIGRPIVIDSNRGSQHIAGIVESGGILYIPDNRNKAVYQLSNQQLLPISSLGNDTTFRTFFDLQIPEKNVVSLYDFVKKQYWVSNGTNCYMFNEMLNLWVTNMEFGTMFKGGATTNQKLYLIGKVNNQISANEMYTGVHNQLFGVTVTPRVKFVVNPDADFSKTFDNQMFVASERLADVDYEVVREQALTNQSGTVVVDNISIEGNFRVKTMRDANSERLRGLRLLVTVNWKTDDTTSVLSSVITKYRLSSRSPF